MLLEDNSPPGSASAVDGALLLCPVCGKPFSQETSHTRHVQYCRRRAAKKGPVRRARACQSCSRSKSKCDFQSPCSRCSAKNLSCLYDKAATGVSPMPHSHAPRNALATENDSTTALSLVAGSSGPVPTSASNSSPICTGAPLNLAPLVDRGGEGSATGCFGGAIATDLMLSRHFLSAGDSSVAGSGLDLQHQSVFEGLDFDAFAYFATMNSAVSPPIPESHRSVESSTLLLEDLAAQEASASERLNYHLNSPPPSPPSPKQQHRNKHAAILAYLTPPSSLTPGLLHTLTHQPNRAPAPSPSSTSPLFRKRIPRGLQQLIISAVRAYPRMMLRPDNLPPFIHPVGCGIHSPNTPTWRSDGGGSDSLEPLSSTKVFAPLRTLEVCINIARLFASRTENSLEFVHGTIDAEHCRIEAQMSQFSHGEALAALQSMIIYTIMRMIDLGYEYFITHRALLETTKNLATIIAEKTITENTRLSRENWTGWIFEETRRRILVTCFFISYVVGSEHCALMKNPHLVLLPSNKAMWEARTARDWEREFDASRVEAANNSSSNRTCGGLGGSGGSSADGNGSINDVILPPQLESVADLAIAKLAGGPANEEALDRWHSGIDGLGMVLAAVVAGL